MRKTQFAECFQCLGAGTLHDARHGSMICNVCNGLGEIIIPKEVGVANRDKFLED